MKLVTSDVMKKLDKITIEEYGVSGLTLMERAGSGAFSLMEKHFKEEIKKGIAIIAGSGNNGGDGFVVARHAKEKGLRVEVYLLVEPELLKGDALENYKKIKDSVKIEKIDASHTVDILSSKFSAFGCLVDAIFGTGFRGSVEGIYRNVISAINLSGTKVLAIDIPSGLNPDTGEVMGIAVRADITATFGLPKIGQFLKDAREYTGRVEVIDIGIPEELVEKQKSEGELITISDARKIIKKRHWNAHKGNFGHLLIIAGSYGKTGAAVLASEGALRTGAGLVTLAVPSSLNPVFEVKTTEAMTIPVKDDGKGIFTEASLKEIEIALEGKDAVVLGPGIGTHKNTISFVKKLLKIISVPVIIDADGLNCISSYPEILKKLKIPVVLTPHPGEMARLCGEKVNMIMQDRIKTAVEFSEKYACVLLLKGALSIIADKGERWTVNPTGNPGMATGGMGDVLAGIIGSLLAQGMDPYNSARLGAFVHGWAGDKVAEEYGPFGFKAGELADKIPYFWKKIFNDFV
jgi:NAD(P)H-hydrate epimerase